MENKCILLVRVSTQMQDLDQQRVKVKEEALRDGYKEENIIIIEDKESGVKLSEEERNGLNTLKMYIERDPDINCVYSYEISRISRRANVVYSIRDYLLNRHIQLIILQPYFKMLKDDGTLSETSNLFFGIFSSLAENEGFIRKARVKRGKEKKRAEGKLTCSKPIFGYGLNKDKTLNVNETEAGIVREVYSRFKEGETSGHIARDLYLRQDIPCRRIMTARSFVSDILREERYTGVFPWPQIITKQLYDICKEIRTSKHNKFARVHDTDKQYLLAGLLYTEEGYAMTPSPAVNKYLKCNDPEVPHIGCNMEYADKLSVYALRKYLMENDITHEEIMKENDELDKRKEINDRKISNIDGNVEEINKENKRIEMRIIKGRMNENDGDKLIDDNNKLIYRMLEEKDDLIYENSTITNRIIYINSFMYEKGSEPLLSTVSQIRESLRKNLNRIICTKVEYAFYRLNFKWKTGQESTYMFKHTNKTKKFFDENFCEISIKDTIL